MAAPIVAGVAVVSRFLLTNSMKKAIKKYGRKAVDKAMDSNTYRKKKKKPKSKTVIMVAVGKLKPKKNGTKRNGKKKKLS